jgi:hypothetical protein
MKFTGIAVLAMIAAGAASAQTELRFGHVGEPGSLFEASANHFVEVANEKLGDDDGLEVFDPAIEGQVPHGPVRHAAAPLVVPDEAEVAGEESDPVTPQRTVPIVSEVCEPVGGLDEQWALARFGPRQLHAVARSQITNVLPMVRGHIEGGAWDVCPGGRQLF